MNVSRWSPLAIPASAALIAGALLWPISAGAAEALTLRVNDAQARPGGVVALVLRTYAPRPIRQGQFCLVSGFRLARAAGSPFESLEDAVVFSQAGDAVTVGTIESGAGGQAVMVEFSSAAAGINRDDGPLAVLYLRLAPGVSAGELIDLELDLANTFLLDEAGDPVAIEPRNGELEILAADAPMELAAAGDEVRPGGIAPLAVDTEEMLPLGSGVVGFRYDPAIARGLPTVSVDPRYGSAILDVEHPEPGLVTISFSSMDGSLNRVPGAILKVNLPTSRQVPMGTLSAVSLDSAVTAIEDASLDPVAVILHGDVMEFALPDPFFVDGFESGDFSGWSGVAP
jgi:hypothetical protein